MSSSEKRVKPGNFTIRGMEHTSIVHVMVYDECQPCYIQFDINDCMKNKYILWLAFDLSIYNGVASNQCETFGQAYGAFYLAYTP